MDAAKEAEDAARRRKEEELGALEARVQTALAKKDKQVRNDWVGVGVRVGAGPKGLSTTRPMRWLECFSDLACLSRHPAGDRP